MGHLGLQPQSVHQVGGYADRPRTAGRRRARRRCARARGRRRVRNRARSRFPKRSRKATTAALDIPTIGIGAGPDCDGQVLVSYDMLGLFDGFVPSFVKQYANLAETVRAATQSVHRGRPGGALPAALSTMSGVRQPVTPTWHSVVDTIADLRRGSRRDAPQAPSASCPTMGALHAGHASLIRQARARVRDGRRQHLREPASIRSAGRSGPLSAIARCRRRSCASQLGVDLVFAPSVAEMYPRPIEMTVDVGRLADHLCGRFRPGHFSGVATVVLKLFEIVQPDRSYFGEKDAQQLAVMRRLVADFNVPVTIVGVPTVREPDGLALSSRNQRLMRRAAARACAVPGAAARAATRSRRCRRARAI